VISASLSEAIMRGIFLDSNSIYARYGFGVSLHSSTGPIDGATEVNSPSYQRAIIGHGDAYWNVGARVVSNALEIVFPITGEDEAWPPVRALGLWGLEQQSSVFLWYAAFTSGEHFVASGDNLFIPAGGLVLGFA
jgi:hypothetical protein